MCPDLWHAAVARARISHSRHADPDAPKPRLNSVDLETAGVQNTAHLPPTPTTFTPPTMQDSQLPPPSTLVQPLRLESDCKWQMQSEVEDSDARATVTTGVSEVKFSDARATVSADVSEVEDSDAHATVSAGVSKVENSVAPATVSADESEGKGTAQGDALHSRPASARIRQAALQISLFEICAMLASDDSDSSLSSQVRNAAIAGVSTCSQSMAKADGAKPGV